MVVGGNEQGKAVGDRGIDKLRRVIIDSMKKQSNRKVVSCIIRNIVVERTEQGKAIRDRDINKLKRRVFIDSMKKTK